MRFKFNLKYFIVFIAFLTAEVIIAIFIRDDFIRPYLGDALVVAVIYFLIKAFARYKTGLMPLYIFTFASSVEFLQYFRFAERMGADNKILKIIIGSTFDAKDIICYFGGCAGLFLFESIERKNVIKK